MKDKEYFHIESMLSLFWKINRDSFKGLCKNNTPDKIGIQKGDIPKVDYARVPVKPWNERYWGS